MTLKNAVNELFDFAKAHNCAMDVAFAKKAQEIRKDSEHPMTLEELAEAYAFSKTNANYKVVAEARETGNDEAYDEALKNWR